MSIPEVVNNAGNLFSDEALSNLDEYTSLDEATLRDHFDQIREHYDRRRADLNNPTEGVSAHETGFFFVARVLHILGYTHSHGEPLPNERGKIDYTMWANATDFQNAEPSRGTSQLYTDAICCGKQLAWDEDLDGGADLDEASPDHPAFDLDEQLRQTGLQWAMLTNGRKWRLYHRNTAGMLNTFYEVDLCEIIETSNFPAFRFFAPFERASLDDQGAVRSMLA